MTFAGGLCSLASLGGLHWARFGLGVATGVVFGLADRFLHLFSFRRYLGLEVDAVVFGQGVLMVGRGLERLSVCLDCVSVAVP